MCVYKVEMNAGSITIIFGDNLSQKVIFVGEME